MRGINNSLQQINIGDKKFDKNYNVLLMLSIMLTGISSIVSFFSSVMLFWKNNHFNYSVNNLLFFVCMLTCFVALLSIKIHKKPFTITFSKCFTLIGILLIVYAIVYWAVPGVKMSGFELFYLGEKAKFYVNGIYLTYGILFLLFSKIIYLGSIYQSKAKF